RLFTASQDTLVQGTCQSSRFSPTTLANSAVLCVTRVQLWVRAIAAIWRSYGPIIRPRDSRRHRTRAKYSAALSSKGEVLPEVLKQAQANLPPERIKTLAFDKAADDGEVHELLHEIGIKPLIQNRALWKEEAERVVGGRVPLHIVHDEAGTVF